MHIPSGGKGLALQLQTSLDKTDGLNPIWSGAWLEFGTESGLFDLMGDLYWRKDDPPNSLEPLSSFYYHQPWHPSWLTVQGGKWGYYIPVVLLWLRWSFPGGGAVEMLLWAMVVLWCCLVELYSVLRGVLTSTWNCWVKLPWDLQSLHWCCFFFLFFLFLFLFLLFLTWQFLF